MTVTFRDIGYDDPAAVALIEAVQQEYIARYGGRDETPVDTGEFAPPGGAFVVISEDGQPIGCGGLRRHDAVNAEIKRMYVRGTHRGRGHGRALLHTLEQRARDLGYHRVVLETGTAQPEALALYDAAGYAPITPYGIHRCTPSSRCFAKHLGDTRSPR
ncbi:MAG: GNAT family N-acetyltransferase [Actinobacteria bacterium]|nr:GNAT family N-acetyltransferase [Actinomycetota bacterium]